MSKSKKKKQIFHSMVEFETKYFPNYFTKEMSKKLTDARSIGVGLAKESIDKLRASISK